MATSPRRAREPTKRELAGAVGWTVLGALLPGLGLRRAGRRRAGTLVMSAVLVVGAGLVGLLAARPRLATRWATDPAILRAAAAGLVAVAIVWVVVIGATFLALRPAGVGVGGRLLGAGVVGLLSFAVAAPLALGVNLAWSTAGMVESVFAPDDQIESQTRPTITNSADPWEGKPRLNVLVLGGDSGTGRSERLGMRADTVIVASIDTGTGAVTLFSLPRQTARMPFPKDSPLHDYFPQGFYDGRDGKNQEYFLNAIYQNVPMQVPSDILGKTSNLGADAMKLAVGEALGLDIDYYVAINMDGFKDFINAIGGITVNVNTDVPIGGDRSKGIKPTGWIRPGPDQHLKGRLALWYARSRYDGLDYDRMERQRCVIQAVIRQATPQNVLLNFEKVAAASQKSLLTDLPRSVLQPLVELAAKVKDAPLRSVLFRNGEAGFRTADPDWDKVRERVAAALAEPDDASPAAATEGKPAKQGKPTETPAAVDVVDECAYRPE